MFKNLLHFWKGKDFLNQVLEEFKNMLDDSHMMFDAVCKAIIENKEEAGLEDKIYEVDKKVNELQKDIRKRIIEHLSIQPSVDVPTCLVLMSVVKDAERLGDYAKNFFQIKKLLDKPIDKAHYTEIFADIHRKINELFIATKEAFIESDEDKAVKSWNYEREIARSCDRIVEKVAKSSLTVNESVGFTLIARYFKRIAAHLTNIATSVVLPITDLDYFDESRRKETTGF